MAAWYKEFESRSGGGVLDTTSCDVVWQWLAIGRWFSLISSINNTDHHDIVEILLKVVMNTITLTFVLRYQIRNDSGEFRNNTSLEFINKLYSLYKIRNSYILSFSLYYDRNLNCSWLRSSSISGASILYRVTDITTDCPDDAINVYNGKWCCLGYNYISKKGCLKIQKGKSETVYRKSTKQWPNEKGQKGKQRSTKHYTLNKRSCNTNPTKM